MDVPAVKPSSLAFITALDPNGWQKPSNRTLVKKHAMKDVGLGRRRPKKNRTFELVLDPRSQLGPGNVDPFAPFPIEMGPLERKLVANIFRDDIDGTQRPYRSSWFSLGFHDVATFYMLLSNSAAHLDTLRGGTSRGLDAERFHMMALQSVSRRLSEPNFEASDGLIGTIAGLITHNDIVGNSDQWTLHFNAVDKLVHLRGGIRSINRILRESVCWIELKGAHFRDSQPHFSLPRCWLADYFEKDQVITFSPQVEPLVRLCQSENISQIWIQAYSELVYFSKVTQEESTKSDGANWTSATDGGGWTNVLIHRLLGWRPVIDFRASNQWIEESLRIGALLYLAPIWRKFGVHPARTTVLLKKLIGIRHCHPCEWQGLWLLEAWVLAMTIIEAEGHDREYLTAEFCDLARGHSLSTKDLLEQVKEVAWIEDVFYNAESRLRLDISNFEDVLVVQ